jgi:hypothetical protein
MTRDGVVEEVEEGLGQGKGKGHRVVHMDLDHTPEGDCPDGDGYYVTNIENNLILVISTSKSIFGH